ncbi:MAG: bacteriocin [Epsilonproteobacteria bacterium]|nr:bacteriocin [Campylobacterota bacterium]
MKRIAILASIALISAVSLLPGCSKKDKRTAVGTVIGAAAGAGIGGAAGGGTGAAIGGVAGGVTGGLIGRSTAKDK